MTPAFATAKVQTQVSAQALACLQSSDALAVVAQKQFALHRRWKGCWLVLGVIGCVLLSDHAFAQGKKKRQGGRAASVVVALVKGGLAAQTIDLTGRAEPVQIAQISTDVAGKVAKVFKHTGDRVRQGEALASQTNLLLQARLAVSEARFKRITTMQRQAKRNAQRVGALRKKQVVSLKAFEEAQDNMTTTEASLAVARAELRSLQKQAALLTLRSPFTGQVVATNLEVGQWLQVGATVYRVHGEGLLEIALGAPSRYLGNIPSAGKVPVFFPEKQLRLHGKIVGVVNHVRQGSGDFVLRVQVKNPNNQPLSGLLARVTVPTLQTKGALVVSRDALVRQANGKVHVVVVAAQNKARLIDVTPQGSAPNGGVLITGKGLLIGQRVVVEGNERLRTGMQLRVLSSR